MDLSIIIPMYNHEEYVEQSLKSIVGYGLPNNIEVIVVNDASTDNSLDVVKKISKNFRGIVIIQNEENLGCAASINKALKIAKGKYIGINSSDDYVDKDYYIKMLETAMQKNADVVCANIATFSDENDDIQYHHIYNSNLYINEETKILSKEISPYEIPPKYLLGHWTATSSSTKIIKKEFYDKYNFVGTKANDIPAIYPILSTARKVIYYPNLYKYYRNTPGSLSKQSDRDSYISAIDSIILTFELLNQIPDNIDIIDTLFYNNCLSYYYNVVLNIEDLDTKYHCVNYFTRKMRNIFQNRNVYNGQLLINFLKQNDIDDKMKGETINIEFVFMWLFEEKIRTFEKNNHSENIKLQVINNMELIQKNQLLKEQNSLQIEKIKGIESSVSWKVTKPIRMFKKVIGKLIK